MRFDLTDSDRALVDGIRDLLGARLPQPAPFDRRLWAELRDAGVFGLADLGLGVTEAVLVFEQLGRALVSGPLVGTYLAAGAVDADVVEVVERAPETTLVAHRDELDALVVLDDDGAWRVDPAALEGADVAQPLDPLTPLFAATGVPQGERIADADSAARWRLRGVALTAAVLLGIADTTARMATDYAKQREQFGRPIGAFQAVKHLCADMHVRAEVARAAVYAAGVTIDDPSAGEPDRAAAGAKLLAGQNALANAKACIQVHGGMGFTWEVPAHLYLKRAAVLDATFGSRDDHAQMLAAGL